MSEMQLVNIGFGNLVSLRRLIAIVSPDSAPVKRLVLIMDSDHVVLSALSTEKLAPRLGMTPEEIREEEE